MKPSLILNHFPFDVHSEVRFSPKPLQSGAHTGETPVPSLRKALRIIALGWCEASGAWHSTGTAPSVRNGQLLVDSHPSYHSYLGRFRFALSASEAISEGFC